MPHCDTNEWKSEPIAIIGLSCKFAGDATSPENLWRMLAEGRNAWSEIPATRFNAKGVYHPDPDRLGTTHVKGAHFLEEDVGLFDAAFFNYSAEIAATIDPQYRLQLESAYEAMENAGLPMSQVAGSNTSVYAGIFTHDYHDGLMRDEDRLPRSLPIGTPAAMASNRISHFFDLRGASITVDTGCSSALVALHQAVLGLRAREADMAIVSGCNLMLAPDMFRVFSSLVAQDEQIRVLPRAPTPKLRPDASYLLVGGLGGLGRPVAHWMVEHGARNLILLSRSAGEQRRSSEAFIAQLREAGCRVVAVSCDVADETALEGALDRCERDDKLPPVRGVIQGAMVLRDSIFEQMTLDDWQTAVRPKVAGSWNLHSCFSQPSSLDFFVMLSSLAGILGSASQSNYAAGGSYQDALARWRQSKGLPAVSIDLGIIKGVGYVAENSLVYNRLREKSQLGMLPEKDVLRAIAAAVLSPLDQPQILLGLKLGPGPQWDPSTGSSMGRDPRFLPLKYRRPPAAQGAGRGPGNANGIPLSARLQEVGSRGEAEELVRDAIATKLADIFMIPRDDIDLAQPPAKYGVDSLVAVELRNMLMLHAASDISIFDILHNPSLATLAGHVVEKSAHVEALA